MKNKIKLHAIGNEGNFNYYIFDKKKVVVETLSKILTKILDLKINLYNPDNNKKINIEKHKDFHENLGHRIRINSRSDIFYGDKKMFITIHCSQKLRLKFNEELFKIVKMPKPSKIKKIKRNKK